MYLVRISENFSLAPVKGNMQKNILFKANDKELVLKFHEVEDIISFADLLEVDFLDLQKMFYGLRSKDSNFYNEFSIKKKSGGERKILAPNFRLKYVQRKLAYVLSLIYLGRPSVHGFRQGKNIVTNAESHVNKKSVFNIDLEDFFPTIHFGRVRGILKVHPYNLSAVGAKFVAGICCYKGKLPQGAPTSPIVSNMICSKLDHDLQALAIEEKCTYSRYADDITFSTTKRNFSEKIFKMESNVIKAGSKLTDIIISNVFKINNKKLRIRYCTDRQEVTGLIVNEFPNVKRTLIKQVRIMLHIWRKFGLDDANKQYNKKYNLRNSGSSNKDSNFYEVLHGKINFIKLVKTERNRTYQNLAKKFNDLAGKPIFKIIPLKDLIDEEHVRAGNRYLGTRLLNSIFSNSEHEIFILDNFFGEDVLGLLEDQIKRIPEIKIKILTSKQNSIKFKSLIDALKLLVNLYPTINIDCREGVFGELGRLHDRFIVIDNEEVFQSGCSLDELGKKTARISRMRTQTIKKEALIDFDDLFNQANKVNL